MCVLAPYSGDCIGYVLRAAARSGGVVVPMPHGLSEIEIRPWQRTAALVEWLGKLASAVFFFYPSVPVPHCDKH